MMNFNCLHCGHEVDGHGIMRVENETVSGFLHRACYWFTQAEAAFKQADEMSLVVVGTIFP